MTWILRNAGSQPCSLYGYPGVSFLDANGKEVGPAATRQGSAPAQFTLPPGQVGSFTVQVGVAGCQANAPQSSSIRVYPPNQTQALTAQVAVPICVAPQVSAVQPGIVNQNQ